jgi:hypothetical protein
MTGAGTSKGFASVVTPVNGVGILQFDLPIPENFGRSSACRGTENLIGLHAYAKRRGDGRRADSVGLHPEKMQTAERWSWTAFPGGSTRRKNPDRGCQGGHPSHRATDSWILPLWDLSRNDRKCLSKAPIVRYGNGLVLQPLDRRAPLLP